ncbi:ArpU family transcriptional regulator [Carnobacterium divergens]|uniref:ArpU family transcriptional regulator n=1 Tax=Carnobacterium divergens TaxID=2748 RepID=A0AAW8REC6_CARDV|nr:ArpU family phage packaging/lysis transcriptional regulator [Carnobacterium divergens]MDT1959505.1 ArpU family transcriptional regulator [Carnobacterium divergens]MDT1975472.1 ArpU family transcriptional regulator [Carnobacterium divergens]
MGLFRQFDKEQTRENVNDLLSDCRSMIRRAHEDFVPKVTQTYSFEIKSTAGDGLVLENGVIRKVKAEQELYLIVKAMNKLNAYDSKIIYDKYMDREEYTDQQLIAQYNVSERTFYRDLDRAMGKFAEAFDNGRLLAE